MRLLPVVRLSIETDGTTSSERQFEKIQAYARIGGHELVPVNESDYDLNVSGSVSPFSRPGLGRWLRDDRLDQWDALVVAKLDRLTRSLLDFVTLVSWLEARGKTLICIDPELDLSTPAGRAFASISATFAQFERDTIAARVRDAWPNLRDAGKYAGGQVPFGYRPMKLDKGWGYEPDPVYGPVVAEMFDRYIRYESLGAITRWLNETSVPTPWNATRQRNDRPVRASIWTTASVRKILGSRSALGATIRTDGTPIRDADGVVVCRADPLVGRDVWERVQARLRANPVAVKVNSWPLTGVAFCALCGASMYGATAKYDGKEYRYLCCVHSLRRDGKCAARRVNADKLEAAVVNELLAFTGDRQMIEKRVICDDGQSEEIARVVEQIGRLFSEIQVEALSGTDVREKQLMLKRAQEELTRLHSHGPAKLSSKIVETGVTFARRWATLDAIGRNEFLRAQAVRAVVSREEISAANLSSHLAGQRTMAVISGPGVHAVIQFGRLWDLMGRPEDIVAS